MFNHKFVSLKVIIDRIKRGNFYKELSYETAIDYGVQAYRLLASEKAEVSLPAKLEVIEYRTLLPENLERVIQAVRVDETMKNMSAMRYATDNLHSVLHCTNSPDLNCQSDTTYSMNNNYMITSFKTGWVFLSYKGLAVDEDCVPMIPDNVNVTLAVEYYIKAKYLDDLGSSNPRIQAQQNKDEQEYCWYIGKAQAHMTAMTMDEYESFANSMSKFFDTQDYHQQFLRGLGTQELIKNQRYG